MVMHDAITLMLQLMITIYLHLTHSPLNRP